ncbi:MAG TPA: twin-arginine translocation signal domain-containing protein, partial [Acidimicrobiales bacterium]|nr:twin-arginine translocation signal domain-containing protein [Acidimicrobiales bacterium]
MEPLSRRRFLQASAVGGAIALVPGLAGCSDGDAKAAPTTTTTTPPKVDEAAFPHGVAAGDPWADSVVLWT